MPEAVVSRESLIAAPAVGDEGLTPGQMGEHPVRLLPVFASQAGYLADHAVVLVDRPQRHDLRLALDRRPALFALARHVLRLRALEAEAEELAVHLNAAAEGDG